MRPLTHRIAPPMSLTKAASFLSSAMFGPRQKVLGGGRQFNTIVASILMRVLSVARMVRFDLLRMICKFATRSLAIGALYLAP